MSRHGKAARQAMVRTIRDAGTASADRVFSNRARPIWGLPMPITNVFIDGEKAEVALGDDHVPRQYENTLSPTVMLVIAEKGLPEGVSVDDALDDLDEETRRALYANQCLDDSTIGLRYLGFRDEHHADTSGVFHIRFLDFEAPYLEDVHEDSPPDEGDLERGDIKYDLGPDPDGETEATDIVHPEQP